MVLKNPKVTKGIVFAGCSFTWGQGLYFYSDLKQLPYGTQNYGFNYKEVNESMLRYKNAVRFPRLVSQHFETFEVVKEDIGKLYGNGGSEDETFDFLNVLFHKKDNPTYGSHLTAERMDFSEVDYIIVQLSQLWRNRYYYEYDGYKQSSMLWPNTREIGVNQDNLFNWMIENDMSFDEWVELHKEAQIARLKREFQYYESKGIKCLFFTWENDLLDNIFEDEYLKSRFIQLEHEGKTYNSIRQLHAEHDYLQIDFDKDSFGENAPKDHHPSKLCHEIFAQNIIRKIESI